MGDGPSDRESSDRESSDREPSDRESSDREPSDREPLDLRLVPAAVAAWLVAWQVRVAPPGWVVAVAVVLGLAGAVLLRLGPGGAVHQEPGAVAPPRLHLDRADRLSRTAAGVAAALLVASAAGLCTAARAAARGAEPLPGLAQRGAAVVVHGVLTDDPRRARSTRTGRDLLVAEVRAQRLESGGRVFLLRAPLVVLSDENGWLGLLPGQQVRIEGRLRPAERGDDVAAVLTGRGPPGLVAPPGLVQRAAGRLRAGLRDAVAVLPDAERGLLPGLVVGDTGRLDPDLREDFRTTGLSHLVAVSGTNCAIVVGTALLLARRLGVGLRAAPVLAGVALVGFVVLARPSPSVLRAAVMGAVGLLALATGGRRRAVPALAGSVLLLVLLDPDLAATPGFALSVLATAGLLLLAPPWRDRLARRLPGWLADALAVPAAAQVACGPVVVALAGSVALLSVPANLLAVPAVAPATVLGVVCALLAPVWLPLAQLVAWLAFLPAAWLVRVARTGAALPGAQVAWPEGLRGALLLAGVTLLVGVVLARPAPRRLVAAGAVGVLVAVVGLAAARPGWPPSGWFLVTCDVGQGDAHVLRAGQGAAVVVDAGPQPALVDGCLRRLAVRAVPLVVLTHLHADHVDGLPGVLRGRAVGAVQVGPLGEPASQWQQVRAQLAAAGVPLEPAALGQVRTAAGLRWEVVGPRDAFPGTRSDPNNSSLVLRVHAGPVRVLLTGDVEPEAQAALLRTVPDLASDVLKLPHHGSRHQDPAFLAAVRPRVVLTSVGAGNEYGHPAPDVLDALRRAGARSYRTDRDGDLALVLREGELVTVGRRGQGDAGDAATSGGRSRGHDQGDVLVRPAALPAEPGPLAEPPARRARGARGARGPWAARACPSDSCSATRSLAPRLGTAGPVARGPPRGRQPRGGLADQRGVTAARRRRGERPASPVSDSSSCSPVPLLRSHRPDTPSSGVSASAAAGRAGRPLRCASRRG